ncbi:DUF423 domain-containing protein [Polluticaenibacter yanchengensis]|uniref:DUF423 domain-containing protein n=1 Tax=Polluticaenibacter yanchengensis TaxID=3014562 RepID=A0ABT4UKU3_9BACT|nr:DUF423 domain-containing protein [Chitinophagaceae bacterium LY-5]
MKTYLLIGSSLALLAVVLGAFGAHGILPKVAHIVLEPTRSQPMQVYKTGVEYQFYHALAIVLSALLFKFQPEKQFLTANFCFLLGTIIFSGSLYTITLGYAFNKPLTWLGAITPIGGLLFITGWIFFIIGCTKFKF